MLLDIDINSNEEIQENSIILYNKKNKKWEIKTLNKILHEYDFKLKNLDDNYNSIIKYFSLIKNEKILERISKLENLLTLSNKRIAFNLLINEIQLGKENVSVERLLEIAQWVINQEGDIPNELVKYIGGSDND